MLLQYIMFLSLNFKFDNFFSKQFFFHVVLSVFDICKRENKNEDFKNWNEEFEIVRKRMRKKDFLNFIYVVNQQNIQSETCDKFETHNVWYISRNHDKNIKIWMNNNEE